MTEAVVQVIINPKMTIINYPMNCLDCRSNLESNQEASPAMGPSPRVVVDLLVTIDYIEIEASKGFIFREIEELRQVCNMQSIQLTEYKVY